MHRWIRNCFLGEIRFQIEFDTGFLLVSVTLIYDVQIWLGCVKNWGRLFLNTAEAILVKVNHTVIFVDAMALHLALLVTPIFLSN